MSGLIAVNDNDTWIAAGWVFRNIVADVARDLQARDPASARPFLDAESHGAGGAVDLSKMTGAQLRQAVAAMQAVRERVAAAGPHSFAQPDFFPGFLNQLDRLIAMTMSDVRMRSR
jgi:hypothetical protein